MDINMRVREGGEQEGDKEGAYDTIYKSDPVFKLIKCKPGR